MILRPASLRSKLSDLYAKGLPPGDRTGWPSVDKHYTVVPGQFTVMTGWPGSGKSEWLDALLINLSRQGWKFCIYSPENLPHELHVSKLLEKVIGKPFGTGPTERMSEDEVSEGLDLIAQRFTFLKPDLDAALSVQKIIEQAQILIADDRAGGDDSKRGLVIDPWNELEHYRPTNLSETEYISQTLSYVRAWAREWNVHVWIVAHPQKLRRDDGGKLPVPRPDSISGSIHWWNKADCAITVHREMADGKREVEIYVQKVRFKHVGSPGLIELRYDRPTGRYFETPYVIESHTSDYRSRSSGE